MANRPRCVLTIGLLALAMARPARADEVANAAALQQQFEAVADRVAPAVVAISASTEPDDAPASCRTAELSTAKLQAFLSRTTRVVGTGFLLTPDGYLLTNDHVIDEAEQLWVTTDDRHVYPAVIVGTDPPQRPGRAQNSRPRPADGPPRRRGRRPPRAVVAGHGQPVRPQRRRRHVRQRRRHQRRPPWPAPPERTREPPLRRPPPDHRPDQPRQQRRPAVRPRRRRDRRQHGRRTAAELGSGADERHRLRPAGRRPLSGRRRPPAAGRRPAVRLPRRARQRRDRRRPGRRRPAGRRRRG